MSINKTLHNVICQFLETFWQNLKVTPIGKKPKENFSKSIFLQFKTSSHKKNDVEIAKPHIKSR
jgi:hypothetical protein